MGRRPLSGSVWHPHLRTMDHGATNNTINLDKTWDTNYAAEINGLQRGPRPTVQMPPVIICLSRQLKKSDAKTHPQSRIIEVDSMLTSYDHRSWFGLKNEETKTITLYRTQSCKLSKGFPREAPSTIPVAFPFGEHCRRAQIPILYSQSSKASQKGHMFKGNSRDPQ